MQADNPDYPRHQLVEALGQCGHQLRSTAALLDSYAAFLQNVPHAAASLPMQNMFQMFTPPQAGVPPAPVATNGVSAPAPAPAPTRGRKRRVADPNAEPEADGTGKKRRRRAVGEKKEKDPNAPKRPPSAYLLFQNEVREEMKKLYPDRPYLEVLNKISARWSSMSEAEKKSYVDTTHNMRAKFEVDKAAYDASHAVQNGAAGSPTTPAAPTEALAAAPTAPIVPSAPSAPKTAAAPAASPDTDSDEASEASAVAAAVAATSETSSVAESSEDDSSDEEDKSKPPPKLISKRAEKPASSKKGSPVLAKPASSTKVEKDSKKKERKTK